MLLNVLLVMEIEKDAELSPSFSRCHIIFAEVDPRILQVSVCESSGALPCR